MAGERGRRERGLTEEEEEDECVFGLDFFEYELGNINILREKEIQAN